MFRTISFKYLIPFLFICLISIFSCTSIADEYQVEGNKVYAIHENGKKVILEFNDLGEEYAAKAYVERWIYLKHMKNFVKSLKSLTAKEKIALKNEIPEAFTNGNKVQFSQEGLDVVMKKMKMVFHGLPIPEEKMVFQKLLNAAYKDAIAHELPDLEEGVIYSNGDNFTIWVFLDPLQTNSDGKKLGYSVKVKDQGNYASFQFLETDYYEEY